MLALFLHFERFLRKMCTLSPFCGRLDVFFRVLASSRVDFYCPGMVFQTPKRHLSMFLRTRTCTKPKCSSCNKTTIFPRFLYGFYTSHASCSRLKPTRNRSESRSNSAFCKDCAKNASWGGFWEGWACFGTPLGRLLFALGWFLASLGCFLGVSWALLGRSWLSLGCSVKLQCWMLGPRLAPGLTFTGFGEVPD